MVEYRSDEPLSIPERLGFSPIDRNRKRAFSQMSYRPQYLLYEDEADTLLERFAPDDASAEHAHPRIVAEINRRFIHDRAYRARVLGGYEEMERRTASVTPELETKVKRSLNETIGGNGYER
jgi:hypothetical protein